jgi:hypothetical protein
MRSSPSSRPVSGASTSRLTGRRWDKRRAGPRTAGAGLLQEALFDLRQAERALSLIEVAAPDPERARYLGAVRAALAQLETFITPRQRG